MAIILCESELERKYTGLVQGKTVLESCLHVNLSEHVNSEIGLGTIIDIESAKEWLRNSFLFQRLQRNPKHYAIGKGERQTWQERLDEMVMESVRLLTEGQLVKHEKDVGDQLCLTEFGDIMSKASPICKFLPNLLVFTHNLLVLHQTEYGRSTMMFVFCCDRERFFA